MEEGILARHDREWMEFYKARDKAKAQVHSDEWLIRSTYGTSREKLPTIWVRKIQRDFEVFQQVWGANGIQATLLMQRQRHELDALVRMTLVRANTKPVDNHAAQAFRSKPETGQTKPSPEPMRHYSSTSKTFKNPIRYVMAAMKAAVKKTK